LDDLEVAYAATRVLSLAETCGLWQPDGPVTTLTAGVLAEALHAIADAGVPTGPLLRPVGEDASPEDLLSDLRRVERAIESSPVPERELPCLREVLGTEALEQLVRVAPATLRRYLSGERTVPDDVADRVHHVALVVNELVGSYNDRGVRRWFERPRPQLGGKAPRSLLPKGWASDDGGPQQVLALARSLTQVGAT
ncbi:hypothetical protein B7486_58375, partial [cyanobacterium TDX16]